MKIIKHTKSVTIGIPAHNEEGNIGILLNSVLKQSGKTFIIKKIMVVLDGCTDNTLLEVKKVHSNKIRVLNDGKRIGQSQRINELMKILTTDLLFIIDADTELTSKKSLEMAVKLFNDKNVGLVSAKLVPKNQSNFIEKCIGVSIKSYLSFIESVDSGSNIWGCKGAFMGISKKLARTVEIPKKVFANDSYLYFSCLAKGYSFKYSKKTLIRYKIPSNITDHFRQNTRFQSAVIDMKKRFGVLAKREYAKGKLILAINKFKYLLKYPLYSVAIVIINSITELNAMLNSQNVKTVWKTIRSTK